MSDSVLADQPVVSLDELRALFTGVPAEDNGWATAPCYTVSLALEIAKRCDSRSESALRVILYDDTSCDDIPPDALTAIKLGVERYRIRRATDRHARGL